MIGWLKTCYFKLYIMIICKNVFGYILNKKKRVSLYLNICDIVGFTKMA